LQANARPAQDYHKKRRVSREKSPSERLGVDLLRLVTVPEIPHQRLVISAAGDPRELQVTALVAHVMAYLGRAILLHGSTAVRVA
jgi:hypothetical protein